MLSLNIIPINPVRYGNPSAMTCIPGFPQKTILSNWKTSIVSFPLPHTISKLDVTMMISSIWPWPRAMNPSGRSKKNSRKKFLRKLNQSGTTSKEVWPVTWLWRKLKICSTWVLEPQTQLRSWIWTKFWHQCDCRFWSLFDALWVGLDWCYQTRNIRLWYLQNRPIRWAYNTKAHNAAGTG